MTKLYLAIPHYNAPRQLNDLLGQIDVDSFDGVYVLDDHSKNRKVIELIAKRHPKVRFIFGGKNLGAGGNRNRILDQNIEGYVWFLDCDMTIRTAEPASAWRTCIAKQPNSVLGGVIENPNRHVMGWSYGHFMSPTADISFWLLTKFNLDWSKNMLMRQNRDYPWLSNRAVKSTRQVDWVAEGSFVVPLDAMRQVDGYNTAYRYHEGQDLAWRLHANGVDSYATSCVSAVHLGTHVRRTPKIIEQFSNGLRFYSEHR